MCLSDFHFVGELRLICVKIISWNWFQFWIKSGLSLFDCYRYLFSDVIWYVMKDSIKCILLSVLYWAIWVSFLRGGGSLVGWVGLFGDYYKGEAYIYNTGSKSIQSCYDKGTENELIMLIIACNKRLNFFSIYMPNPNNFYLNCPHWSICQSLLENKITTPYLFLFTMKLHTIFSSYAKIVAAKWILDL